MLCHLSDDKYSFSVHGLFVNKHIPPAISKSCLSSEIWNSYFKFVFVRNPWDWFVSQWKYYFFNELITFKFKFGNQSYW